MCFSQTASFAVAATLAPFGAWCLHRARTLGREWTPLALFPLAFAAQQASEGLLWRGLGAGDAALIAAAARGFLFFSHFFWLAWAPFAVWRLEPEGWRRPVMLGLTVAGALFGLSIFLPSLLRIDWLEVTVIEGSIEYRTTLIYDGVVGRTALRGVYAAIIVSALLLSSRRPIRMFGALIVASLLAALTLYPHAFISVWCFFAAVLSACVAAILLAEGSVRAKGPRGLPRGP